jgi:hypothetical protein
MSQNTLIQTRASPDQKSNHAAPSNETNGTNQVVQGLTPVVEVAHGFLAYADKSSVAVAIDHLWITAAESWIFKKNRLNGFGM